MKRWVLALLLPLAFLPHVLAQTTSGIRAQTGIAVTKTCPTAPQPPGSSVLCSFTVQNRDPANPITNLSVENTVPCDDSPLCTGGATTLNIPCTGGTTATTLAPFGQTGDTCNGSVTEKAPACGSPPLTDQILAQGTDQGTTQFGFATNQISAACTSVPTLSFPMLGLLAAALIGAALWLLMRR